MDDVHLEGKVALVTGAGSRIGLGRAMTMALVRAGARVAMVDTDAASLQETASEMQHMAGRDCVTICIADVANSDDAQRGVEHAIQALGGLHILVNNAGINPRYNFWDLPNDAWVETIATNVNGPFFMAKAAAPHMRQQGWGRIVGVTTSLDTMLATAPYGPSKAAHEAFVAVLARQLEGTGLTANIVIPGDVVHTHMTHGLGDASRMLQPEVMQAPLVWLASDDSDGFNGRRIIAQQWDARLPIDERLQACSAPAGWPQLAPRR
jgi:3-oxoacyl-[acyl-carrier protein] reductase